MAVEELTPLASQQRSNMDAMWQPGKRVSKDPAQRHTNTMRATLEKQIKQIGAGRPVTLLNLNPFTLQINGGMLFWEVIPACPLDQPYVIHVFDLPRWTHKDTGVGLDNVHRVDPFPVIPKTIAAEYMREYQQEKDGFGGVICYMGDHHPSTIKKGQTVLVPVVRFIDGDLVIEEEERDFNELLAIVRSKRNQSLMRDIQQAVSWHENPEQAKNVNDIHRDKARMAFREKLIPQLPKFCMQEDVFGGVRPDPCKSCGTMPNPGAILCINCNEIFNVVQAYKNTRIAYGCAEFDRLSEEEWKEVNAIKAQRDKMKKFRMPETVQA